MLIQEKDGERFRDKSWLAISGRLGNLSQNWRGVVAQLVERLVRNEKVRGSTPLDSTKLLCHSTGESYPRLRLRPNLVWWLLTNLHQFVFGAYFVEQRGYPKQETVFFLFQPPAERRQRKQQHPDPRMRRSHDPDNGQFHAGGGPKRDAPSQ